MIKFFRKIRQGFLDSGEIKSYSLYAIGEIVLVVLGILIALQINNWNEQNKNKHLELQLLKDLNQEFQLNQNLLKKKLKEVNEGIEIHDNHLGKLVSGKYTYKNLVSFQDDMIKGAGTSDPAYGVINSLIASGNIKLIRNDSLKYELTSWKDKMTNLYENEKFHLDNFFKYTNYCNGLVPKNVNLKYPDLPEEKIDNLYMMISKDLLYRNLISENTAYLKYQVKPELEKVTTACEKIIQLISKEID